jgi:hypothetical protein
MGLPNRRKIMKRIHLAFSLLLFCFPLFAQNLNSNQVRVNGRTFTIGVNTYDADYAAIFNQWYKGHKSAEEAKQGEDLSWINDFTRAYKLSFLNGSLIVGDAVLDNVNIISFAKDGGVRDRFGGIGLVSIAQWLVYDSKTGKLIGAQFNTQAYNAYFNIGPQFFDMPDFLFPLTVNKINSPISSIDVTGGLISYKNVFEYQTDRSTTNGMQECIYKVDSSIAAKIKQADDFAKTMKKAVPTLFGTLKQNETLKQSETLKQNEALNKNDNATHRLTADLNVFTDQDGGSSIVTSLNKGDGVQVLRYGEYADWNGITAKWANVKTVDGKTGWLFSGYLEELKK